MALSSTLVAAATAYFDALSTFDAEKISSTFSPEYQHTLAPTNFFASLGIKGPLPGNALLQGAAGQKALFSDIAFKIKESWPNEATNVVTAWVVAQGTLRDEFVDAEIGTTKDYYREYVFILTVGEDGKIENVLEFVDTLSIKSHGAAQAKAASRI
ncbi:hypothetical protein F5X68DRAFT_231982 [Plectosphaerella plurivora]|uniref:SnoaL-like domain-containing protein n=1 Tax=Plectosphaerella plurivora TaxID=936078 RepID=A0A9P8VBQ9_9PEZI|nr:hypothetical protein F5X68DRAFT_231982 [Plectosphaerella plurivora]